MTDKINELLGKYRALMKTVGAGLRQYKQQKNTLIYGAYSRNKTRIVYEGEDWMRVLFVRPSVYDNICDWYDRMGYVQNNRKTTVICKSPIEFFQKFDATKFGARYTTFYFDDLLPLTDVMDYFVELTRLYGKEDARYISEDKMRQISTNSLLDTNRFDDFRSLSVDPDCIEDIMNKALDHSEYTCVSLL